MKTNDKYILDDKGDVIPCDDLMEWAGWFETSKDKRKVAYDEVGDHYVSTVFLGLDHSFGRGEPLLFETMVFEKEKTTKKFAGKKMTFHESLDGFSDRYHTKEEAVAGHKFVVGEVKKKYEKGT